MSPILATYLLYQVSGEQSRLVRRVAQSLQGSLVPVREELSALEAGGDLLRGAYNWRTDTYDYRVAPGRMVPLMLQLAADPKRADIEAAIASVQPTGRQREQWQAQGLTPSSMQALLWQYISAGFDTAAVNLAAIDDNAIAAELDTLLPAVADRRFQPLLMLLREDTFCTLLARQITADYATQALGTADGYRQLAEAYRYNTPRGLDRRQALLAATSTLAYLADGRGHVAEPFDYRCELFDTEPQLLAFYRLVTLRLHGSAEARRKATALVRDSGDPLLDTACRLLFAPAEPPQTLRAAIARDADTSPVATLLCRWAGVPRRVLPRPKWLFLRHESSPWLPLDARGTKLCTDTYGPPRLAAIHRQQQWETTLAALTALGSDTSAQQQQQRTVYHINSTADRDADRRQQQQLRNGQWSAGRRAAGSTVPLLTLLPDAADGKVDIIVGRTAPYTPVTVRREPPYITIEHDARGFRIVSNVTAEHVADPVVITSRTAAGINFLQLTDRERQYYQPLLATAHFPAEAEEQLRAFLRSVGTQIEVNSDLLDSGSTLPKVQAETTVTVQLRPHDRQSYAYSIFVRPAPDGLVQCEPGKGETVIVDGQPGARCRYHRDLSKERMNATILNELPPKLLDIEQTLLLLDTVEAADGALAVEWPQGAQIKTHRASAASGAITIAPEKRGWFEIDGNVQIDEATVMSVAQLLDLTQGAKHPFVRLADGEYLTLSHQLTRQLQGLAALATRTPRGTLRTSTFAAALLSTDVIDGPVKVDIAPRLLQVRQHILHTASYAPPQPAELQATLRPYQLAGYQWMARLNSWGAGALLADDMGLGKTVQTIALLLADASQGPALVVAPASVAPNWLSEMARFAPTLHATFLNYAAHRAETIQAAAAGDVIVTTYGLLLSVKDDITAKHWHLACLDEAHIIKNRGAKTSAVAMRIKADNRVMLTGTPIQNHLGELWNLFQFLNPGLLGSYQDFSRRYGDDVRALQPTIAPFILRRTKETVATELPDKQEIVHRVDLTTQEAATYEAIRRRAEQILETQSTLSAATLAEITHLRLAACDATLVLPGPDRPSSKTNALMEIIYTTLESVQQGRGGILVFSQFTTYLTRIRHELERAKIPYLYIDGSTPIPARTERVQQFQDGQCPLFLISLKAGGLGLNLTRANYVIHADPWWNPAIQAQATDRAHRIGQRQHVTVYHLLATGTIEEKIHQLNIEKQRLADDTLLGTNVADTITGQQLLTMIRR